MKRIVRILGTRGIPARHGGFETFVEHLSRYLTKQGWKVIVYCQEVGAEGIYENQWNGIRLIHVPVEQSGAKGTIVFDWKSTVHAAKSKDLILTLGYNTAVFCLLYRIKGIKNIINMDGIEWKRDKYTFIESIWLRINERIACWLGNHLVADNPEIKNHFTSRVSEKKITMIPYGADEIEPVTPQLLENYTLEKNKYAIVIARPVPENLILEIVTAFSERKRNVKLVVLGNYDDASSGYQQSVLDAASDEVVFLGAIYEKPIINSLRYHALLYIHGHTVGGTNPSLVEALGAGNPVLAHGNKFNKWVIGSQGYYFNRTSDCSKAFDALLFNSDQIERMKRASKERFRDRFTWNQILAEYEALLISTNSDS